MAGFNYGRMQATATRLLGRFDQGTIQLVRTTTATPDPATPWVPGTPTTATYDLAAAVAAVTDDQAASKLVDGTSILASDLVVTCAVPPIEPLAGDTVTIDGASTTVMKVIRIPGAGVAVAYKLIVRA